jgi:hypothetical protein
MRPLGLLQASSFPRFAGPPGSHELEFIPPCTVSPSEFLVTSLPSDIPAGPDSLEVLDTLQRHPRASPMMKRAVLSLSGSALRLSQPLSGFLARSSSTALFRAATVPGHLPFRAFPSQRSCAPLEATGSLAVIHPGARVRYVVTFRLLFHRLPRSRRSCQDPQPTMGSLSTYPEGPVSRSP